MTVRALPRPVSPFAGPEEQVGRQMHPGQPIQGGRITRKQYRTSFRNPIRLKNGKYLFMGKMYKSIQDIMKDVGDGKIDGNNISFSVTLDIGKFEHKGVISGDQIKMTYDDGSGQSGEIIVKKAK